MHHLLKPLDDSPAFTETDAPLVVVDRGFTIRAVNPAHLAVTGRAREELLEVGIFEVFPDNPDHPGADGVANLTASFEVVFRESIRHRMALQRYDIPAPDRRGPFLRRYWDPVTSPLRDERGRAVGALLHVEDVTEVLGPILAAISRPPPGIVAESYAWNQLVGALARENAAHASTRTERDQLRQALDSRVVIEQAKGVLAARLHCSPEEAFVELRRRSRSTSTRIHDLARRVVDEAALPGPGEPGTQAG